MRSQRLAQADAVGMGGRVSLARLRFRARRNLQDAAAAVSLGFTSLGSSGPSFEDLMSRLRLAPIRPRIQPREQL